MRRLFLYIPLLAAVFCCGLHAQGAQAQLLISQKIASGGGSPPAFVGASALDSSSTAATLTTGARTTTAANLLYVMTRSDVSGNCTTTAQGNLVTVTDLGGDTFINIPPAANGCILTILFTGGSGYMTTPTFSITAGCSSAGTYGVSTPVGGVITNITTSTAASGCAGAITGAFAGGSPSVPATATGFVVGITDGAHGVSTEWYAKNIAGTTNNTISYTQPTTTFSGLTTMEISGASTTAPLDSQAEATSSSSVSSVNATLTTVATNTLCIAGGSIENTANVWTAATNWTRNSNSDTTTTSKTMSAEYQAFTSVQTGITATSVTSSKTGSFVSMVACFKP